MQEGECKDLFTLIDDISSCRINYVKYWHTLLQTMCEDGLIDLKAYV